MQGIIAWIRDMLDHIFKMAGTYGDKIENINSIIEFSIYVLCLITTIAGC